MIDDAKVAGAIRAEGDEIGRELSGTPLRGSHDIRQLAGTVIAEDKWGGQLAYNPELRSDFPSSRYYPTGDSRVIMFSEGMGSDPNQTHPYIASSGVLTSKATAIEFGRLLEGRDDVHYLHIPNIIELDGGEKFDEGPSITVARISDSELEKLVDAAMTARQGA